MLFISKESKGSVFIKPKEIDLVISFFSSSTEPIIIVSFESSVLQIGRGIPQNLDLERFQSFALESQLPNLPSPVDLGFQLIDPLSFVKTSLFSVTLINQESRG